MLSLPRPRTIFASRKPSSHEVSGATSAPTSAPLFFRPSATNAIAFFPARLDQFAILADHRFGGTILRVQAFMRVAVAIGQPAFVDRFVVARHRAQHFAAARMQPQVGTERIVIADRFACDQFPGARLEAEYLVRQRADRAHVDDVAAEFAVDGLADVGADFQVLAAAQAAEFRAAGDFGHEAHATRTLYTTRHLGFDQRADVFVRHHALALGKTRHRAAVAHRQILQLALAALIADRAIQRMVDQQKFHHVALRRQRSLRLGEHLHAFHHRRGAGRLRLRHGLAAHLRLDHAHAAIRRDRQFVVIAETRDRNAGLVGRGDDHRVLRHLHGLAVDLDVDEVGCGIRRGRLRAHAAPRAPQLPTLD